MSEVAESVSIDLKIYNTFSIFSSIGALEMAMSVCRLVGRFDLAF
jgi:hypothetical protein